VAVAKAHLVQREALGFPLGFAPDGEVG